MNGENKSNSQEAQRSCKRFESRMNRTNVALDEYFEETLARVRPYILQLTCAKSVQLCEVWLHKLNAAFSQRRLRNEYLLELYKQLKAGRIQGVFSRPPSNGLLLPLPKSHYPVCISSSVSDLSDSGMKSRRNCFLRPNSNCVQHQRSNAQSKHQMIDIRKLQAQNEYLKNQLIEYQQKDHNENADDYLSASISQLTADVTALKAKLPEIQRIKSYLEESYKETIQEYHCSIVDEFSKLKHQLEEERVKNEALNNSIVMISEKLEEIINGKDKEIKEMERQWMDKINVICERFDAITKEKDKELQHKQDLLQKKEEELMIKDVGKKEKIEALTNKIYDLEEKLETKIRDEDKLQAMLMEQYTTMKEEFSKMRKEIDYESQKQNENLLYKVSSLKKSVVKLEKSKEKLQHDYEKKVSCIIKNKDMEIKNLQLRFQEQKNELCTSLNRIKQNEMGKVVNLLEKQYRSLLAEAEAKTESQAQEYLKKIAALETQILHMSTV